jgi:hypothetical protein
MIYIYYLEKNQIPFYVGYTKNLKTRVNQHRQKYGIDIEILDIEITNSIDKKLIECYWIEQFRQWGFDLINQNKGGGGPLKHSEESKEGRKDKKPMLGKKQSDITKQRKSKALKGKKKPYGFGELMKQCRLGVPKPEGMGCKVSKNRNHKKAAENNQKPIIQYDLEGNFIKEWHSIKEASKQTNSNASSISKVCRKILKKTNNFIWVYKK